MKANKDTLEDRLQDYQEQLRGLKSYLKELHTMTAKHGTAKEQFAEDLTEAEHNIKFYEAGAAEVKKELGKTKGPRAGGGHGSTPFPKPGLSSLIFSSIGFIAGALFGSKRSRKE